MKYFTPFIGNLFLLFALPALADQGERILALDTSTCAVGEDCCTGVSACLNAGSSGTAVVNTGSCHGDNACQNAGRYASASASIGVGSCTSQTGGYSCQNAGRSGFFETGDGSCISERACSQGGRDSGSHLKVGAGSCVGVEDQIKSCELVAMQVGSVEIGDQSCLGNEACRELGREGTATVGNDSCVGNRACWRSAKVDGEIQIGNGSCKATNSCRGLAMYALEGHSNEVGRIVIGDNACNCEGCCGCLRPGDVVPDGMCNELGNGDGHCCMEEGDRNPFGPLQESNLCVDEQNKCLKATVSGDPHITTFSGLKYDCMGQGEFILSKSQSESDPLEIRGLFVDPNFAGEDNPWENDRSAQTVTRGVAFIVDEDVPMIRVTTDSALDAETCNLYYYVEGVGEVSVEAMMENSTLLDRTQVDVSTNTRSENPNMRFMFGDYDADIRVSVRAGSTERWGCIISFSACLKPVYHGDVLGLFGTNNIYRDDDWTTRDGTQLQVPMRPKQGAAQGLSSQYCLDNWCYKGPEGNPAQGSFFSDTDFNYYSRCDQSPYTNRYNETAMEAMLDAMRESCAEQNIFHITSEVLYDAAVLYHISNPDDTDCPVELIADAEENNAIAAVNCWTTPTPAPVPVPNRTELTPTGTGGDPHFHTWKKEHFEYHGQCDLTLVKDEDFADGLGLDIQIRTKVVRYWSYIKNAAIRIGNDILEFEGTADVHDPNAYYWVNYEYQGHLEDIAGFPVTQHVNLKYKRKFIIDLSPKYPGTSITIQTWKEFLRIKFDGDQSAFANTVGLLGDYTTGKTLARDGVTEIHDYSELGDEWQVLPSEPMLFHETAHPQFPERCIKPEDPRGVRKRRLAESSISLEEAEAACSSALSDAISIKDCIYDILATQDMDMVGAF